MARKNGKGRGSGLKFSKNMIKYTIILVMATFLLGAFSGVGTVEQQAPINELENFTFVSYSSTQVAPNSALARIVGITNDFKLVPNSPQRVKAEHLGLVFESGIEGVSSILFETSNARDYDMFHFFTNGTDITDEVNKRIRLPGDYILYRIYRGETEFGPLDIVGRDLDIGQYAKVFVIRRIADSGSVDLGFLQSVAVEGPTVNAQVLNVSSMNIGGRIGKQIDEEEVRNLFGASEVGVAVDNESGMWMASAVYDLDAEPDYVVDKMVDFGFENITVYYEGMTSVPKDVVLDGTLVSIKGGVVYTNFKHIPEINETVRVDLFYQQMGSGYMTYATEI